MGSAIGLGYNGTVLPLIGGFAPLGIAALALIEWTNWEQ